VLTDVVMPGAISGKDLARHLRERDPSTKIIFTSGYSEESSDSELFREGINFLRKPYHPPALTRMIHNCLASVN
jgi:CheY-like chemotaxis protein